MSPEPLINTAKYTTPELLFFAAGGIAWALAYMGVLREIVRKQFVEIPATAVCANIAWEFVWGFLYPNELGRFFSWGYRAWFFFDLAIVYLLFRFGDKQVELPELKAVFKPACVFGIAAWAVGIYFFVGEGYDTGYGAISGYILNTMMSALYVVLILRHGHLVDFSLLVAWSKMLGTALLTVFNFVVQPGNPYLLLLCLLTLALDLVYIGIFYAIRSGRAAAVLQATREVAR